MTKIAAVIGDPVGHSLSPSIHNAAFAARQLDWVYVAFHVPRGAAANAIDGMRALELAGLNVTMPHKEAVALACDALTAEAAALQSVNTVVRRDDGTLFGLSTDGPGLLCALEADAVELEDRLVVVLGAGGAGRAVTYALAVEAGARVAVWARREDAAMAVRDIVPARVSVVAPDEAAKAVEAAAVVINATPLGMHGEPPPFDPTHLQPNQTVVDLIYRPSITPLLTAARACGARAINGLSMLVHQAALAFEAWTGVDAPIDAMVTAARVAAEMADSD